MEKMWNEWLVTAIGQLEQRQESPTISRVHDEIGKRFAFQRSAVAAQVDGAVAAGLLQKTAGVGGVGDGEDSFRASKAGNALLSRLQRQRRNVRELCCHECGTADGSSLPARKRRKPVGPLSFCAGCPVALHDGCANGTCGGTTAVPLSRLVVCGNRWFCGQCNRCDGCAAVSSERPSGASGCVIECIACERRFHFRCMIPAIDQRAEASAWKCMVCRQRPPVKKQQRPDEAPPPEVTVKGRKKAATAKQEQLADGVPHTENCVADEDRELFNAVRETCAKMQVEDLPRTPAAIRFGKFEIKTWYSSPFPQEYAKLRVLYFCEFCLKFMKTAETLERHRRKCEATSPPGDEIYREGAIAMFEVDGLKSTQYCQSLCLIAKLFLDHKTLFFDVEPFLFYVMVKWDRKGNHILGYFSKEKNNAHKYNVSCIMTMPQYQRQGYGRFMIDFSYFLSRMEGKTGTPEKPLSALGQKSYSAYWRSQILQHMLRHKEKSFTIKNICKATGMTPEDVISALQALNFLKYTTSKDMGASPQGFICVDWDVVDKQGKRCSTVTELTINESRLKWSPPGRTMEAAIKLFPDLRITDANATAQKRPNSNILPDNKALDDIGDASSNGPVRKSSRRLSTPQMTLPNAEVPLAKRSPKRRRQSAADLTARTTKYDRAPTPIPTAMKGNVRPRERSTLRQLTIPEILKHKRQANGSPPAQEMTSQKRKRLAMMNGDFNQDLELVSGALRRLSFSGGMEPDQRPPGDDDEEIPQPYSTRDFPHSSDEDSSDLSILTYPSIPENMDLEDSSSLKVYGSWTDNIEQPKGALDGVEEGTRPQERNNRDRPTKQVTIVEMMHRNRGKRQHDAAPAADTPVRPVIDVTESIAGGSTVSMYGFYCSN